MKDGFKMIRSIAVPSEFDSIAKVEILIDEVCSELQLPEENFGNILIAVTEAVNNAIIHGNKSKKELEVGLSVADSMDRFCFSVKDEGEGFDYNNLPDPTAPENIEKENGRGIFLMRSLADDVCYNDKGNIVEIYFSKN